MNPPWLIEHITYDTLLMSSPSKMGSASRESPQTSCSARDTRSHPAAPGKPVSGSCCWARSQAAMLCRGVEISHYECGPDHLRADWSRFRARCALRDSRFVATIINGRLARLLSLTVQSCGDAPSVVRFRCSRGLGVRKFGADKSRWTQVSAVIDKVRRLAGQSLGAMASPSAVSTARSRGRPPRFPRQPSSRTSPAVATVATRPAGAQIGDTQ
jgi:hypothetical protein